MATANNESIKICKAIAKHNGMDKEPRRNVVVYNGEKWSFSVSELKYHQVECRQCYEDTVGFITYIPSLNAVKYFRFGSYNYQHRFLVSRVSASGIKAFNVNRHIIEMSSMDIKVPSL